MCILVLIPALVNEVSSVRVASVYAIPYKLAVVVTASLVIVPLVYVVLLLNAGTALSNVLLSVRSARIADAATVSGRVVSDEVIYPIGS